MISNKTYSRYEPVRSKEEIFEWLDDSKVYSNKPNYMFHLTNLVTYKDAHRSTFGGKGKKQYRNIYAHNIVVMLPTSIKAKEDMINFANYYALFIDSNYKRLLYCFKIVKKGRGTYIDFIFFTRYSYSKIITRKKKHTSDYYQDSEKKIRCNKNNPNAVLKHSKGEVMKDKDGNDIEEIVTVAKKEEKIFKYVNINDLYKFLKGKILDALHKIGFKNSLYHRHYFTKIQVNKTNMSVMKKQYLRNSMIEKVNKDVNYLYEALINTYPDELKSYYSMLSKIDKILYLTKPDGFDLSLTHAYYNYRNELEKFYSYLKTNYINAYILNVYGDEVIL